MSNLTQSPYCDGLRRRRLLKAAGAGLVGWLVPNAASAQVWKQVEAIRQIAGTAAVVNDGLDMSLPLVAEDGSSVPVTIQTRSDAGMGRIVKLDLFAPKNPTAEIAAFEFTGGLEALKLSTRIRLSESQTVVALARTEDGRLWVTERAVRVTTSGCVAPAGSDPENEMKARVRLPKAWKSGTPAEVLTMISHPMVTGLAKDTAGNTQEQRIIESFQATLNGESLVSARYFRSMAANPYLKVDLVVHQPGELRFEWVENTGKTAEHTERVTIA